MKLTCLALDPSGTMRPEPEATVLARWREGRGSYWIHLVGGSLETLAAWLLGLGLDAELLALLQTGAGETRIVPLNEAVFVAYPVPAGEGVWEPAHFGILCLDRLVVTMQSSEASLLDDAPVERLKLREGTSAGVVCSLAIVHATRLRRQVVKLRREGDVLADRTDSDPWAVPLAEILAAKRRVLALGGVVDEELAVLEVLRACHLPTLSLRSLADTFQIAIEVARATDRDIDRLERRLSDLHERYETAQREQTNRRLGVLTVLSAIFMPLSLIAGIYGMNFEVMPELHYPYAYPITLAAMASLAGGLFWYFRTRWLPGQTASRPHDRDD